MRQACISFLLLVLMCGCLYPQERREQVEQIPEHISRVQSAVDRYYDEKKVLPYRYSEEEIAFTSKSLVDFSELQGYLGEIPATAYEKGGSYLYVLTDVEEKAVVRLFDLRVKNQLEEVQKKVLAFQKRYHEWPASNKIRDQYYLLDVDRLNITHMTIPSPYDSQAVLPFVVDQNGQVYLDYRAEAMKMIQKSGKDLTEDQDLRYWMARESYYVPAYAVPMQYVAGEPVFVGIEE